MASPATAPRGHWLGSTLGYSLQVVTSIVQDTQGTLGVTAGHPARCGLGAKNKTKQNKK